MCRADITPAAAPVLDALLTDLRTSLAEQYGADPDDVRIGPVDFVPAEGET